MPNFTEIKETFLWKDRQTHGQTYETHCLSIDLKMPIQSKQETFTGTHYILHFSHYMLLSVLVPSN